MYSFQRHLFHHLFVRNDFCDLKRSRWPTAECIILPTIRNLQPFFWTHGSPSCPPYPLLPTLPKSRYEGVTWDRKSAHSGPGLNPSHGSCYQGGHQCWWDGLPPPFLLPPDLIDSLSCHIPAPPRPASASFMAESARFTSQLFVHGTSPVGRDGGTPCHIVVRVQILYLPATSEI